MAYTPAVATRTLIRPVTVNDDHPLDICPGTVEKVGLVEDLG